MNASPSGISALQHLTSTVPNGVDSLAPIPVAQPQSRHIRLVQFDKTYRFPIACEFFSSRNPRSLFRGSAGNQPQSNHRFLP